MYNDIPSLFETGRARTRVQREKNMSDRISLLGSTALAALMLATATPAHAQATDPANAGEGGAAADEIVVTGLRPSMENAAPHQHDSGQIQDSIFAAHFGKLHTPTYTLTCTRNPR